MIVVGLAGYATAGKDEAAKQLGWQKLAFADALKEKIDPLFPPDTPKSIKRETYVAYGRAMRAIDPDYWVKQLDKKMPHGFRMARVAVSDLRYVNEGEYIVGCGGILIYIERPGLGPANQEEATSLNLVREKWPDMSVVINDGTSEELGQRVKAIIRRRFGNDSV